MDRVQKIIAASGLMSRRKAEDAIAEGRVKVNNITIELGTQADSEHDTILVDGQELPKQVKKYYMLHKPRNYITTTDDPFAKKMVIDLLPKKEKVYPVGRLDKDATGLLLLTNDGDFANSIAHPSKGVPKTYIAVLKQPITQGQIKRLAQGVDIEDRKINAEVVQLEKDVVAITVHVGIHKVVKRLFKAVGSYVRHLHRTHIGALALDVEEGDWRELTLEDKELLKKQLKLSPEVFQ